MRTVLVLLALLLASSPAIAQSEQNNAQLAFDRAFLWLEQNWMKDGYIVSDSDRKTHFINSKLIPAPPQYRNDGVTMTGETTFQGVRFFTTDDKTAILIEQDGKLKKIAPGTRIPGADQFVFSGFEGDNAVARLIFLYHNTDTAESLMRMYRATGDKKYLVSAGDLLRRLTELVGPDGKFYMQFASVETIYRGMPQGILMRALNEYWLLSKEEWANGAVDRLAKAYEHTTEGTWDHWTNSVLGMLTANERGLLTPPELIDTWKPSLAEFMEQIRSQDGKFPQIMDKANTKWPMFFEVYQSYNLSVLMQLAEMDPSAQTMICEQFANMFASLPKTEPISQVKGKMAFSALVGKELCGVDNDAFIKEELASITSAPKSVDEAVDQLLVSSSAQAALSDRFERSNDVPRQQLPANIEDLVETYRQKYQQANLAPIPEVSYSSIGEFIDYGATGPVRETPGPLVFDQTAVKFDADGIPLIKRRFIEGLHFNPVTVEQFALAVYSRHLRGDDIQPFLKAADRLIQEQNDDGSWRYHFEFRHYTMAKPYPDGWISGLAQGQSLSVFARAYHLTGDKRYLDAGNRALSFLLRSQEEGGPLTNMADLSPRLSGNIYFEEYLTEPDVYTLNGYIFILLGLYDWWKVTGSTQAQDAFQGGVDTLAKIIHLYDIQGFSTYDLAYITNTGVTKGEPHMDARYHRLHILLLRTLFSITDEPAFKEIGDRWNAFVESVE